MYICSTVVAGIKNEWRRGMKGLKQYLVAVLTVLMIFQAMPAEGVLAAAHGVGDLLRVDTAESAENLYVAEEQSGGASKLRQMQRSTESSAEKVPDASPSEASPSEARVLLIYLSDSDLGETPEEDTEAMKQTLLRLDGITGEDIEVLAIPWDEEGDANAREQFLEAVRGIGAGDEADKQKLIYYSGHGAGGSNGASFLALGGSLERSWVSAKDLRDALSDTKGEVVIMLDACFSGGMMLTTNGEGENADDSQAVADAFAADFVREFRDAGGSRLRSSYGSRFKIVAAASQYETSLQRMPLGGDMTTAIGRALGFDRHASDTESAFYYMDSPYQTVAADTDRDRSVSMKELAAYCKKQAIGSSPVFFPENDDSPLFSYNSAEEEALLSSPTFDVGTLAQPIVKTQYAGEQNGMPQYLATVEVEVEVRNLADEEITVELLTFPGRWDSINAAGNLKEAMKLYNLLRLNFGMEELPDFPPDMTAAIGGGEKKTISLTNYLPEEYLGMQLMIRIDTEESGSASQVLLFEAEAPDSEKAEIDKEALSIISPWETDADTEPQSVYLYDADGLENSLPVIVQFDQESPKLSGYASCRLELGVYRDEGASEESHGNEKGELIRKLYEDLRPMYGRDEMASGEMRYNSLYTYHWDLNDDRGEKIPAGLYRMVLKAYYDDGTESVTETKIEVVNSAPEGDITYISSYGFQDNSGYELFKTGGLKEAQVRTIGAAPHDLKTSLNILRWTNAEGELIDPETAETEPGKTYISLHEVRIEDPNEAETAAGYQTYRFSPKCALRANGHDIRNVEILEDGALLRFELVHRTMNADPKTDLRFYAEATDAFVGPEEALPTDSRIWILPAQDEAGNAKVSIVDVYYWKTESDSVSLTADAEGAYTLPEDISELRVILCAGTEEECGYYYLKKSCAPIPDPEPSPEPDPEPTPEPQPEPEPTPSPEPTPDPEPEPSPEPQPDKPQNPVTGIAASGASTRTGAWHGSMLYTAQNWEYVEYFGLNYWRYKGNDGKYLMNGWHRVHWNGAESWYLFDERGFARTGWVTDTDGRIYYLNPVSDGTLGSMLTGWHEIDGKRCYFREASPYQGEYIPDLS